jgi:hypothetical protein
VWLSHISITLPSHPKTSDEVKYCILFEATSGCSKLPLEIRLA